MRELSRAVVVRRSLGRGLPATAGVVLIAVLVWRLGTGPFVGAVTAATMPSLALALALGAVTTGLSALRWSRAARLLLLPLPPARALADYYIALFLNAVLPGGVLGDVRRAGLPGGDVGSRRNATAALLLERSAGQLVLVVVAATVWLVDPRAIPGPDPGPKWRVGAAAVGVGVFAVAVTVARVLPVRGLRDV